MYTVLWFKVVFDKIIEENWKKICVEISYSLVEMPLRIYKKMMQNIYIYIF